MFPNIGMLAFIYTCFADRRMSVDGNMSLQRKTNHARFTDDVETLDLVDAPDPVADAVTAVVRIESASINPSDVKNVADDHRGHAEVMALLGAGNLALPQKFAVRHIEREWRLRRRPSGQWKEKYGARKEPGGLRRSRHADVIDAGLSQIADIRRVGLIESDIAMTITAFVGHEPVFRRRAGLVELGLACPKRRPGLLRRSFQTGG
jgi:hypothetical protein